MGISATAKSKIKVGSTLAASSVGDFDGDTFVEIKFVENLGEFGDTAEEITFATIEDSRVRKLKGVRDGGTLELTVGRSANDAGQIALRAAAAADEAYNFTVIMNDKPEALGTPTEFFFRAMVMGAKNNFGGVNDVTKQTFNLSITSEIFEIPAAAAA